jgi:cobalt-zinc-cadmium efflux system outer membrane protein
MRFLSLHAATWAALLWPLGGAAAPLSLASALELAEQRSQATHAARAGVTSAAEAARAAGQLPDPMLRAGIDNLPATGADRFNTTRDSMTMKRIGISQEWLSAPKRAARQAAAEASVGRESVQARAAAADTRLQTALAYIEAYFAAQTLELTTVMAHHAFEELEAARARLASSAGSSQEVLALTGAQGVADDDSAEVRQQQVAAQVALQRWLGVQPDALLPLPAFAPTSEADYLAAHPTLAILKRDVDVARRVAAVTAAERQPNWTWEVSYAQRSGYADMVSLGVSIPLPVAPGERQHRETAAKLALVDKTEAELAEAERAATAEYRALASDAQRLRQRIERYRAAVATPAGQRTAAALAAYRSNQGSLAMLFEARHAEVGAQRRLLALQRDLARTEAQLAFKPLINTGANP